MDSSNSMRTITPLAPTVVRAGANILVASSAVYDHPQGVIAGIAALHAAIG